MDALTLILSMHALVVLVQPLPSVDHYGEHIPVLVDVAHKVEGILARERGVLHGARRRELHGTPGKPHIRISCGVQALIDVNSYQLTKLDIP